VRETLVLLVMAGLLTGSAVTSAQRGRVQSDQDVLEQLERDWDDAFMRKDLKFIESVLADEFTVTYGDGVQGDKAAELKNTAEFNQQVDTSEVGNFQIKIYGNTAVVRFEKRMTGPSQGKTIEVVYRMFDVFVLRDGRWLCVASQSTKVQRP
jgi:ketosteroid isomerase-like protein